MILDQLTKLELYKATVPQAEHILSFLKQHNVFELIEGQYPINGESAYIIIQNYQTKPDSEKKWESHKKFIDVQLVLEGTEHIGYRPIDSLNNTEPYNDENDFTLYPNDSVEATYLKLNKGDFAIFYPNDAHKPGVHLQTMHAVKKAVIKVAVN